MVVLGAIFHSDTTNIQKQNTEGMFDTFLLLPHPPPNTQRPAILFNHLSAPQLKPQKLTIYLPISGITIIQIHKAHFITVHKRQAMVLITKISREKLQKTHKTLHIIQKSFCKEATHQRSLVLPLPQTFLPSFHGNLEKNCEYITCEYTWLAGSYCLHVKLR